MSRIEVRGACEHNLADIDLDLERERLVVFTGVSGSGKTSLALDTLHAEGQRRYLEALAPRDGRRGMVRPRVRSLDGMPPPIALTQSVPSPGALSTVGTRTELWTLVRALYAGAGVQHCPTCDAVVRAWTHGEIAAELLQSAAGARLSLEAPLQVADPAGALAEVARSGFSRVRVAGTVQRLEDVRVGQVPPEVELRVVVDRLRLRPDRADRLFEAVRLTARAGGGQLVAVLDSGEQAFSDRPWCGTCDRVLPPLRARLLSFRSPEGQCSACGGTGSSAGRTCGDCGGSRLSEEARAVRWRGVGPAELTRWPLAELVAFLDGLEPEAAEGPAAVRRAAVEASLAADLSRRVQQLVDLGVGQLCLGRAASTVSAGEAQLLRLARQVGARMSGVLYVLDEPAAGLGAGEVAGVVRLLKALVAQGNSAIAVSHRAEVIEAAEEVVDFGPGAGAAGGQVVFQGPPGGLLEADTASGRWLSGRARLPPGRGRSPRSWVRFARPTFRNLRGDLELPTGALVALTGPSGSGKTSVLELAVRHVSAHLRLGASPPPPVVALDGLDAIRRLLDVDRTAVRARRSTPATYTGLWDVVRRLLASTREAQIRGLGASAFSLNVKGGRCEACRGTGTQRFELELLPDLLLTCPVCEGRRFTGDVREVRWKGHGPDELLALRVDEARALLGGHPRLDATLRALSDVGLGYVPLGQPAHTLSGGEAHRLRLARELARTAGGGGEGALYLIDDPTVGLHPADVAVLLEVLQRLVDQGGTVWFSTHDRALAERADWCIELGRGAGAEGGTVVEAGPPA